MNRPYADRSTAGRELAEQLARFAGRADVVVLALPRGGLPVAFEIARVLGAPLDVLNVRKLGVPWQPELAMGALATGGVVVRNESVLAAAGISETQLEGAVRREEVELERREREYREGRPACSVRGKTVILVDDGVATGSTMRAAVMALRQQAPARIVVGVPVAPPSTMREMASLADECICLQEIDPLYAIGMWYVRFPQVSDDEVRDLLHRANATAAPAGAIAPSAAAPARTTG